MPQWSFQSTGLPDRVRAKLDQDLNGRKEFADSAFEAELAGTAEFIRSLLPLYPAGVRVNAALHYSTPEANDRTVAISITSEPLDL